MILSERPQIMSTMLNISDLDDDQLLQYQEFQRWYDQLSQFDRDLFFLLNTGHPVSEIANLMDCSQSLIYTKRKKLIRKK